MYMALLDILKLRIRITSASGSTYGALKTYCTEAYFREQACHRINASVLLTFNYSSSETFELLFKDHSYILRFTALTELL